MVSTWYSGEDECVKDATVPVMKDEIEVIEVDTSPNDLDPYDINYKVTVLGQTKVGKSAIIGYINGQPFNETSMTTVGIDFIRKKFRCENAVIQLTIYDSAGQEKFRVISGFQLQNTKGVVLVYDITDRKSFEDVHYFSDVIEKEINLKAKEPVPVFLVGNKSDLEEERVISYEEGQQLADKLFAHGFFEASAKNGQNIVKLFKQLSRSTTEIYNPKLLDSFLCRDEKYDIDVKKKSEMIEMKTDDIESKNGDSSQRKQKSRLKTFKYRLQKAYKKYFICSCSSKGHVA